MHDARGGRKGPHVDDITLALEALKRGLVTPDQLQDAKGVQDAMKAGGLALALHEVLLKKGYITASQMEILLGAGSPSPSVASFPSVPLKDEAHAQIIPPAKMRQRFHPVAPKRDEVRRSSPLPRAAKVPAGQSRTPGRSAKGLWIGVGVGIGLVLVAGSVLVFWQLSSRPARRPVDQPATISKSFSDSELSALKGQISSALYANDFNLAMATLTNARPKLTAAVWESLKNQVEREAMNSVTSLIPGGESDALDELPRICAGLRLEFRHFWTRLEG